MIYLSFIGNHDKIIPEREYGAFTNIYLNYRDKIGKIVLFITQATDKADYGSIAKENIDVIKTYNPDVEVIPVLLQLANPVDYDLVYPVILNKYIEIAGIHKIEEEEKVINITSGTPTMTSCWILLSQSGIIKNAKLVQSFEKQFSREGRTVQEVNFDFDDFPTIVAPAAIKRQLTITFRENKELKSRLDFEELDRKVPDLIGRSKQIMEIKDQICKDIDAGTNILILGERGTGKEIVASSIWKLYHTEQDEKLITVDCGSFQRELIQSELFGHVKGSFTGALTDKEGLLSAARNKMIFLDEIGNLPIDGQQKLLRVLSHGEIRKVGSNDVNKIEIQIIAATNKNVDDPDVFAQDIKDRFDEIICLPSLKERKEDIPLLIEHFLKIHTSDNKTLSPLQFDSKLIKKLTEYDWPGNVRELEQWVRKVTRRFREGGVIKIEDLPERLISDIMDSTDDIELPELPLPISLKDYIERIKEKARYQAGGNTFEVDRLLKQKSGNEKQRIYRAKNKKGN
jgi:DNA-binding NtrC family response regulator